MLNKTLAKVSHKTEGLRSFLGLANFYRKFIKRFLQLEKPFLDLSKKELSFEWGDDQPAMVGVSEFSTCLIDL